MLCQHLTSVLLPQADLSNTSIQELCSEGAADQPYILSQCPNQLHVVLAKGVSPSDGLKAFVHAKVLQNMLSTCQNKVYCYCLWHPVF